MSARVAVETGRIFTDSVDGVDRPVAGLFNNDVPREEPT